MYFDTLASKLKTSQLSSRDWWKTLKSFITPVSSKGIPPLLNPTDGEMVADEQVKADILNDYFVSRTYIDDSSKVIPQLEFNADQVKLNSIIIIPSEVKDAISCLHVGKASGPDGINNRILLETSVQLSQPLCDLFNASLSSSVMPSDWKCSNVCAIFKKGDPSNPSNYRPISLLNTMEKVFERIIFKHVFNFLRDTHFFTSFQSGFMPGDSTVNQLTYLYNQFCQALDNGLEIRVVFFDISKAFDKVWHRGLLYKLQQAGVCGRLLSWFSNYLENRHQRVVIPGASSSLSEIKAGVPQG